MSSVRLELMDTSPRPTVAFPPQPYTDESEATSIPAWDWSMGGFTPAGEGVMVSVPASRVKLRTYLPSDMSTSRPSIPGNRPGWWWSAWRR